MWPSFLELLQVVKKQMPLYLQKELTMERFMKGGGWARRTDDFKCLKSAWEQSCTWKVPCVLGDSLLAIIKLFVWDNNRTVLYNRSNKQKSVYISLYLFIYLVSIYLSSMYLSIWWYFLINDQRNISTPAQTCFELAVFNRKREKDTQIKINKAGIRSNV